MRSLTDKDTPKMADLKNKIYGMADSKGWGEKKAARILGISRYKYALGLPKFTLEQLVALHEKMLFSISQH